MIRFGNASFRFVFVSFLKMLEDLGNEVGTKNGIEWKPHGKCEDFCVSPWLLIDDAFTHHFVSFRIVFVSCHFVSFLKMLEGFETGVCTNCGIVWKLHGKCT